MSASDIDLQLRRSYTPEQGSTRIEYVLASGTGTRIVISHDDVCLTEFQAPTSYDLELVYKELNVLFKRAQLRSLTVGVHVDRKLLQFRYTSKITDSVLRLPDETGLPGGLRLRQKLVLVVMVDAGVTRSPPYCHRFWQQLRGRSVEFAWQSEEEISLAAVLRVGPTESLIQGLHQALFHAEECIGLVLFGKGNTSSRWLELSARERTTLSAYTGLELVLAGTIDSKRSLLNYDGLNVSRALAFFSDEAAEQDEELLPLWMYAHPYNDLVVLDITADGQLAGQYLDFASHGLHVINANKLANTNSSGRYHQIHDVFGEIGRHWLYSATVGTDLPVNHAVRDLIDSGDTILGLSGVFLRTLSWLSLQLDGIVPFTDLVDQAWQQGLTGPDSRIDLSDKDVMRELMILAQEAGYDIEPDQVYVEPLVPAHCEEGSVGHLFENGEEPNEQMLRYLEAAREMGLVLYYVARFDANGKARVGVEATHEEYPPVALPPCDNVLTVESRWYRDNPLMTCGPGAGRDVTAGVTQSDTNRLAQLPQFREKTKCCLVFFTDAPQKPLQRQIGR